VNVQAQAYAGTLSGSLAVAMQSFNKLLADMGSTQLPLLTQLLQIIVKIIDAVDDWTQKHQKLTEDILIFIGVLGVTLTVLGTLLVVAGTVGLALAAGLSAAFIGIAAAVAIGIAAIVAIGVAIVQNWDYIRNNFVAVWQILETGWNVFWTALKNVANLALQFLANLFGVNLAEIEQNWNSVWTDVSSFFVGIWDNIKSALTSALAFLTGQLNTFVSWAKSLLGDVLNPVQGISNLISGTVNLAKGAAGAVSSVVNVHDAVITPGGQVIKTDPSDYLFATKTPGSMGGGGVTINLNGGMFLNDQAVTLLANTIAKQINRQVRTRNYAM
jgi:phage-related minor tail protein